MRPLVKQLAVGFRQLDFDAAASDFGNIKLIAAADGFVVNRFEKRRNGGGGFCVGAKAVELRMMPVAFGLAAQDFLCQQGFAPEGDQAFGVEIFRVQRPQAHAELKQIPLAGASAKH